MEKGETVECLSMHAVKPEPLLDIVTKSLAFLAK
jgi:hypothetical protein